MMVPRMKGQPVEILLVEDNQTDVMMIRKDFNGSRLWNNLHVAVDGEEAMDFLYKRGRYSSAPSPVIILLALNLSGKNGREVLAEIKGDSSLQDIPVIVLTTSVDQATIWRCYRLGANCFIAKPFEMDLFIKAMEYLGVFWFTLGGGLPRKCESRTWR